MEWILDKIRGSINNVKALFAAKYIATSVRALLLTFSSFIAGVLATHGTDQAQIDQVLEALKQLEEPTAQLASLLGVSLLTWLWGLVDKKKNQPTSPPEPKLPDA